MACSMGVLKVQDPDDRKPHIPFSSTTSATPAMVLPEPTYAPPVLKKRPHVKKQHQGHIPRPRNAFILFRCDYVRQKKIPAKVEKDHRNISRIIGQIWRQMSEKQRRPWVLMADRERMVHSTLYSSYRFSTGVSNKISRRGDDVLHETQKPEDHHFWDDSDLLDLYRSSSCPPGTLHVPQANLENSNGYGAPLKTRDDMARQPSRVTFYQSTSHQLSQEELTDINNQHYFVESIKDDYFNAVANQEYYTEEQEWKAALDKDMSKDKEVDTKFCGPHLNVHPYPTPGPNDPPEWDVVPTQPYTWADWSIFQIDQSSSASSEIFGADVNKPFFIDPFLSTLPPLPHSSDSNDTFSAFDYSFQQSFIASETEGPSTYSPLERCKLPDVPPEDIHNVAEYNSKTTHAPPFRENDHHDWSKNHQTSSFSGLAADFQHTLDYTWDNNNAVGHEFNAPTGP